ncbi:ABC transporter permease [Spirosoma montaniterrae]|uniref:ABC transporter permease n=1 Tax=Spirosoma montaniterrae TaxID=1178516 RepID=A0A1P9WVK4_9BACT|nr:ABC transporter permease [Spirosoma montaniterrae]AQG79415.1 hypothetical protein AWR27_08830 [Spirosoma montaniterrae]
MLQNYLKIAVRNLWRNPLYSLLNLGGLALSTACCLLIALYVYDEWSYDRHYRDASRIFRVVERQQQPDGVYDVAATPGPLAPSLKATMPDVVEAGRIGRWNGLLRYGRQVYEEKSLFFADNGLLQLFNFPFLKGNPATALTRPDELVLTETAARRYFGANWQQNPKVIGATLRLNNERDYRVVGVLRDLPTNTHLRFDVLLSFKNVELDKSSYSWDWNSYHTYVRMRPNWSGDRADFGQKLTALYVRNNPTSKNTLSPQPLTDIHLYSDFAFNTDWGQRGSIFYVRLFATVGLIVLLIACVNFINLATARSMQRAREVGVRKTIGAHRRHLIFQFLGESFLLTGIAVGLALLLASGLMPLFNDLTGKTLTLDVSRLSFWVALVLLTGLIGLLAGAYPAFLLSSFQPATVLKGAITVRAGVTFRQVLVVGQFALSLILIISSVLIYRQLVYIQQKDLGFDKSQLLYARMAGALRFKAAEFKQELLRQSGIESAAATTATLVDVANESDIEWEGRQGRIERVRTDFFITQMNIDPDFTKTVGMKVARGSNFRPKAATDTNQTYLINETAARRMGYTVESAIGKRVKFWGKVGPIVGVVRDFHFRPLNVPIQPFIFRYAPDNPYFQLLVKTRPGQTATVLRHIEQLYKQYEKESPLHYGFVDQELDQQYQREQRTGRIVLYFSGLAVLISCLGLFGLAAFTAEQRTKEIGIRKVLGASVASIVALLSKDFLKLVGVSILIASPLAWYAMNRWLADFAYRIDIEWWVFALAGVLAVGIALLTVSFQSIKAALMNPVKSLRSE